MALFALTRASEALGCASSIVGCGSPPGHLWEPVSTDAGLGHLSLASGAKSPGLREDRGDLRPPYYYFWRFILKLEPILCLKRIAPLVVHAKKGFTTVSVEHNPPVTAIVGVRGPGGLVGGAVAVWGVPNSEL